jgi:hypothetical protein
MLGAPLQLSNDFNAWRCWSRHENVLVPLDTMICKIDSLFHSKVPEFRHECQSFLG